MRDGKLFFKPYKIEITTAGGGPHYAASVEEKERIADTLRGLHDFTISTITQATDEVLITTNSSSSIQSVNELNLVMTDNAVRKKYLIDQALKLDTLLLNYTDLKTRYVSFAGPLNNLINKTMQKLDAVVSEFQKLP